ncbi:hypothetical protein M9Y10_020895 [Tritrichomonas musculus]|uniref:Uncharacterized protein n=1 Tax=Tritrichomonas musculus TaxID=1915356 RepID=A0ABR2HEU5_9EUKA
MASLACEEHNSQETGKDQIVYITTNTFDESQIDNVDFRFVIDRIKNEIKEQFPTENLLVLLVCGGDMFIDKRFSEQDEIVAISRDGFRIETETNVGKNLYICNDFVKDEVMNIKVTKDNFEDVKENMHESVVKYLHDVVHWI